MRKCWKYLTRNKYIAAKNIIRVTAHDYRINLNIRLFKKKMSMYCVLSLNGTLVERTGELKCPNLMYC